MQTAKRIRKSEYRATVHGTAGRCALAVVLAAALGLAGCANTGPREQAGTVIGGAVGGLAGHQVGSGSGKTAATIVGTLVGAAIGGSIGQRMDARDRRYVASTLEHNRTGDTRRWTNPDTGHKYAVTPTETYRSEYGPCREYRMTAYVDGRPDEVYGTACRQPDGSWKIQS